MAKTKALAASVSVLGALAALILFLRGLDSFHVWAASPLIPASESVSGPLSSVVPVQALDVPTLLFPDDDTATRDPRVSFGWSDVGALTYTLKVDEAFYETGGTSMTRELGGGTHTWTVQAWDASGTPSGYADPWQVTVDITPPSLPTLIGPEHGAFVASADILFSWSSVEGAAFYNLRLDGETYTTTLTSLLLAGLSEGAHHWAAQAQDELYNASGYSTARAVTVDTGRPTVTLVAPVDGAVLTTTHLLTVTIQGTASDAVAGVDRVEVNTGDGWDRANGIGSWTYGWVLPVLDNGLRELSVRAFDRAGNASDQPQVSLLVDTLAPTAGSPLPDPPRSWVTTTVAYDWPPSEDGSGIDRYQIHIYNTQDYSRTLDVVDSWYVFVEATQEGEDYMARVRVMDGRGNWSLWSAPSTVVPDLTPPAAWDPFFVEDHPKLHAVGTRLYYNNTVALPQVFKVGGYASDALSGVEQVCLTPAFGDQPPCYRSQSQSGFEPWQSGGPDYPPDYAIDPGAAASGVIVATVLDRAGNRTWQSFYYELDETPPESSAVSPDYATTSPILVDWTVGDTQSGVRSVDLWYRYETTGTWAYVQTRLPEEDSFRFAPLEQGVYYFATVARDNVDNLEEGVTEPDAQTVYDTSAPAARVIWAPPYWNKPGVPITMTWVATPSLPANPVTEVRLWYRYDQGEWNATSIADVGSSGVFVFDRSAYPPAGDGVCYFEAVAQDASGKSEALPFGTGDRTTVYDAQIDAPIDLACVPSGWTHSNSFTVRWTNPADLSGVGAAYFRIGSAPAAPLDGTRLVGNDLVQISEIVLPAEGEHKVWVWLEDRAGNVDHADARHTTCRYDAHVGAPIGLTVSPSGWTPTDAFTVTWSNPGDLSGIAGAYWKLDSPPASAVDGTRASGVDLDRIGPIAVINEGAHTLYLWLYDGADNVGFGEQRTASLYYDPTPPAKVLVSTPISMTKASFEVYWTADGAASGLAHYTIEYSRATDMAWQPWLTATTAISGLFTAPLAGTDYAFRVTAYDRAGNSARAQTAAYLDLQRAYMPIFSDKWYDWYIIDTFEPNDTFDDAKELSKIGQTYLSYIWNQEDRNDFYYFSIPNLSKVEIRLEDIPAGKDYDLYVWYWEGARYVIVAKSEQYTSPIELVRFMPTPGVKYWIQVYPYQGPEPPPPPDNFGQTPYRLTIAYVR